MGVVEPACRRALAVSKNKRIGMIATQASVRSGAYEATLRQMDPEVEVVCKACPLLVPLVENGWISRDDREAQGIVRRYIAPLQKEGIDTLILGCTHFPLLAPILSDELGPDVVLIDAGKETAAACVRSLQARDALSQTKKRGTCRYYVSDCPEDFSHVAEMFLGRRVEADVRRVELEELDRTPGKPAE